MVQGWTVILQQVSPQQTAKVSVWDLIDAEIEPLTNEQRSMLSTNEEYVANYNNLQSMVQAEVLNLVRANIENSPEGKALLDNQLKLVKNLKTSIIEMSQREMQLFNAFKEATVNVIDMMKVEVMMEVMAMMKKNVCFLCKCLE